MFSPSLNHEGGPAMATRSRRRQRPLSSDSLVQQPKAKRQRVPLTEQTFVNPDMHHPQQQQQQQQQQPEMHEVKSDKIAKLGARPDGIENATSAPPPPPTVRKELSVRSKKPKPGERMSKGDGSIVLTSNNTYTVNKLPALPDRIRADAASRQHGAVYASNGYALSLSHTHALVWPYTAVTPSPETFVFTLPYPSKHSSEPLPLGALVSPSAASDEPGLVVVMPISGRITYWEYISSAATLDFLRQQRNGVEDTIPGLWSGERAVQMTSAEPAGFILAFNSGRVAHLSVRDGQGKPAISVQFLRGSLARPNGGGIFGSIRNALKQAVHPGDLATVRADRSTKAGPKNVVAATSSGMLRAWRVHRGGHHENLVSVDARDTILHSLKEADASLANCGADMLEVLDLTFVPRGIEKRYTDVSQLSEAISVDDDTIQHVLLLVSVSNRIRRQSHYALVEVILRADTIDVGMIRGISSYSGLVNATALERPHLYLPRPGLVAFVVFDRAVAVVSIARPPDSPDSQLQEDNHTLPATFEDVIDLRDDDTVEIVGSGMEEPQGYGQEQESSRSHRAKTKNPTALLMIKGVGVVRVAITDIDRFASDKPPQLTAKSKLEQAVFFGLKDNTPLLFEGRRDLPFTTREIEEAALDLSRDILASSSPYLPALPASLEYNLRQRVMFLDRLMSHLNALKVKLSRRARWGLLWNAEKMSMAASIWRQHESFIADRSDNDRKSVVSEIVEYINEDEKVNPNIAIGELDRVRHWFIHDVWRLEIFIPWGYQMLKVLHKDNLVDDRAITRFLFEAVQITYETLHGALEYRVKKLPFYGLSNEDMEQGILVSGYEGLPEPWTSTFFITNNLKRLVELCHIWLDQYYPPQVGPSLPDPGLIESIRESLPNVTDQYLVALQEHSRWATISDDSKILRIGDTCAKLYLQDRHDKILKLKDYNLGDDAIAVAEQHHSLSAMAELIVQPILMTRLEIDTIPTRTRLAELEQLLPKLEARLIKYVKQYGRGFAFPAYELLLRDGGVQMVLDQSANDQEGYATLFFREKPELAKISWINDVEREQDISHAAKTLLDIGLTREQQVWNKKIELSLGKLALMAEGAGDDSTAANSKDLEDAIARDEKLTRVQSELEIIDVQDQLYQLIFPSINNAVDEAAELMLAMQTHDKIPKKHKALHQVIENSLSRLLKHEALDALALIDLLTLLELSDDEIGTSVENEQFFLALRVATCSLKGDELWDAKRLIWRRCFLRDDWTKINNTENQDDDAVLNAIDSTRAYRTMYACFVLERVSDETVNFILKPSEAVGVYTDRLDRRFNEMEENFREKLLDAMQWEDSNLRKYVEKCQLDRWGTATREAASNSVSLRIDQLTAVGASEDGAVNGNGKAADGLSLANGSS